MGAPNPGIVGNIKIVAVDGDTVSFHTPRYCAINADGSPYFVVGYWMTIHAIQERISGGWDSGRAFDAYVATTKVDYSLPGDVVQIDIEGNLPHMDIGDLFSAQFINQYPVG